MADTPDVEAEKSRWRDFYYGDEKRMGFLQKIKMVLRHPSDFFERVRDEKIGEAIKFYLVLYIISLILMVGLDITMTREIENIASYSVLLVLPIVGIVGLFISTGITHLFVRLLKGKGHVYDTCKVVIYSMIPSFLIGFLESVFLTFIKTSETMSFGHIMTTWFLVLLGVISFVYSLYLEVVGLSKYHNISKKRALAALVIPILIFIILVVLLIGSTYMWMNKVVMDVTNTTLETVGKLECSNAAVAIKHVYISGGVATITVANLGYCNLTAYATLYDINENSCSNNTGVSIGVGQTEQIKLLNCPKVDETTFDRVVINTQCDGVFDETDYDSNIITIQE